MNKAVLIVLLAFVACSVAQLNSCATQYKCQASNQLCGVLGNSTVNSNAKIYGDCPSNQFCNYNAPYNLTTGVCQNLVAIGASCAGTYQLSCVTNAFCSSGTCKANVYNVANGQQCTIGDKSNGCVAGLYCVGTGSTGTCQTLPGNGADCSSTSRCYGANSCISNKCVAWGSVSGGNTCIQDYDCSAGQFCNATTTGRVCATPAASSNAACNSTYGTGSCTVSGESCGCSNPGTNINSQCYAAQTYSSSDLNTIINYINCAAKNCAQNNDVCSGCNACNAGKILANEPHAVNNQCGTCSSGVMVAASLVFAAVAAFFAL